MKKCILSANCQGELLKYLLNKQVHFTKNWDLHYYVNFHKTPIPKGEIENCDLLIHQNLDDTWGELSATALTKRAPKKAKILIFPNLVNFHLWPTAKWSANPKDSWQDNYIETLIKKGLNFSEIVYIVMKTDFAKLYDLPFLMKNSLRREYEKNYHRREELFSYISNNWKNKQLFTTPNHPANELIFIVLNSILEEIQIPSVAIDKTRIFCDNDFFLPVHPFFIKYYDIKFLHSDSTFPVYGKSLTYKQYLLAYVDARLNNHTFLDYLVNIQA